MPFNQASAAFRRYRRYLQGAGIAYRRSTGIAGAAAATSITVPGMSVFDELVSVLQVTSMLTPTLTPVAVAAGVVAAQTFTVLGLQTADVIASLKTPAAPGTAGLAIVAYRVSAVNTLEITYWNQSAAAITPTSQVYQITVLPGGQAVTELMTGAPTPAVQATLTDTGAVSKLKFIANSQFPGSRGNAITVQYAGGASAVSVAVTGSAIVVNFITGTSTVNDLLNALRLSSAATGPVIGLVDVDLNAGTGADLAAVMAATALAGGVDASVPNVTVVETGAVQATLTDTGAVSKLKFIANSQFPGTKGNAITVAYVGGATAVSVAVSGSAITVNFITGTSTVNDLLNALQLSSAATGPVIGLVDVDLNAGTGTNLAAAMAATALAGGADPSAAIQVPTDTRAYQLEVEFLTRVNVNQ